MEAFAFSMAIILGIFFMYPYQALTKYHCTRVPSWIWLGVVVIGTVMMWVLDYIEEYRLPFAIFIAWLVFGLGCCLIIYIKRDDVNAFEEREKEKKKQQEEAEKEERMRDALRKAGIDPDEPTTLNITLYSSNNHVKGARYLNDEIGNICIEIENTEINERREILADTEKDVVALAEEVLRLWARQEKEFGYLCTLQNYAKRPPRQYRTVQFVGIKYRGDDEYMRYKQMKDGEKVLLVHEWGNPYDDNAVKVMSQDGYHIGYLAREYAKKVGELFNDIGYGWHYHYDEQHDFYNAIHVYKNYIEYEPERDTFEYELKEDGESE